jgi:Zn-finger nucleic acid-binding protein
MTVATIECPKCLVTMQKVERSGVVIDRCRDCGGLFLDHGELQALLSAETDFHKNAGSFFRPFDEDVDDPANKKATRRGFLEELFDFG